MCWHKWRVSSKEILPSFIEQIGPERVKSAKGSGEDAPMYKPCIVTYYCAKCGAEKVERA